MQASLDTLSNISKYMKLEDPSKDPISSLLLSSIINGLFSQDRMKVVSSLDTIRHLSRVERNEKIMSNVLEKKVCERLCELLTLCDIMLLIYTLECILAVTEMGETACNEIVRVNGSVSSFISLVTVEVSDFSLF
jgi:AT-rich interactive domain-containing protein 2